MLFYLSHATTRRIFVISKTDKQTTLTLTTMKTSSIRLPKDTQEELNNVLTAYDSATVLFYNGKYHVTTNIAILDIYPSDYRVVAEVKNTDIYTAEEIEYNYSQL